MQATVGTDDALVGRPASIEGHRLSIVVERRTLWTSSPRRPRKIRPDDIFPVFRCSDVPR